MSHALRSIVLLAFSDPARAPWYVVFSAALFVATASATQDIVIDAFRIESLPESQQAAGMAAYDGWIGRGAAAWQFVLGIGRACAVTALPILILLMEKLELLRQPIGQRILRYASLDDVAIWGVHALILKGIFVRGQR